MLLLYAGPTKVFDITLMPHANGYTRDEIVQTVNQQLSAQGEDSVKAEKFGEKYISISSDKYVVTGLSGNMIKVDGVSSFLYDISGHGKVTKSNGYNYGRAFLNEGITIEKGVNDELTINVNGIGNQTIHLLDDEETVKSFSSSELLTRLNERFETLSLPVTASLSGNFLMLRSEHYGNGSSVQVISSSNAYRDLFTREDTLYYSQTYSRW